MARIKKTEQLTELELEIMKVLWEAGSANVHTVQHLLVQRSLAYTTVQTMLNVLYKKARVKRKLIEKAYFYSPAVSRTHVVSRALDDMITRLFAGSAESLVMSMVEGKHLSAKNLARLSSLIEAEAEDGKS